MTFKVTGYVGKITNETWIPLSRVVYEGKTWIRGVFLELEYGGKKYNCALLPLNDEAYKKLEERSVLGARVAIEINNTKWQKRIVLQGTARIIDFNNFQCWTIIELRSNSIFLLVLDQISSNNLEGDMGKKLIEHSAFELVVWN